MKKGFKDLEDDSGSEPEEHRNPQAAHAAVRPGHGGGSSSSDDGEDSDARSTSGSGSSASESDGGNSEDERVLEEQLADIPFEVLEKLKQDGIGPVGQAARAAAAAAKQKSFKRETKNRPQEVSSKRQVSRFREVIQVPKHRGVDPRFDPGIAGGPPKNPQELDRQRKRYAFLYDDVLPQEVSTLKQRLKKEKREPKRREMQAELTRLEQRLRDERTRRKKEELEKGWKTSEKKAVAEGKKPFYLKKSEKRKRELVAKYEELKSSGRLEKYMAKRRRKNASKDHRYLPGRRGGDEDE